MLTSDAVKVVLAREGLSKYKLAQELGVVSSTSVNQWLRGTRMSASVAKRFKELYQIKISDSYDNDTVRLSN